MRAAESKISKTLEPELLSEPEVLSEVLRHGDTTP